MNMRIFYLSAFAIAGLMAGCDLQDAIGDRTTTEDLNNASVVIDDQTSAQLNTVSIFENVNNFVSTQNSAKSFDSNGPTATLNGNTLTLDFNGVENCSGKIIVEFNGVPMLIAGRSANITFENYKNNGTAMDGEIEMKVISANAAPQFSYKTLSALTIKEGDAAAYQYTFDETIVWAKGKTTLLDASDDVYYFEGTATQVAGGKTNEMIIEEKLVYAVSCDYLKEGIIKFTNAAGTDDEFVVRCDFSVGATANASGECDGWVKIYTDDLSMNFNLAD